MIDIIICMVSLFCTIYFGAIFIGRMIRKLDIGWPTIALMSLGIVGVISYFLGFYGWLFAYG